MAGAWLGADVRTGPCAAVVAALGGADDAGAAAVEAGAELFEGAGAELFDEAGAALFDEAGAGLADGV